MANFQNYNPKRVFGSWLGIPVRGFMRGTFIRAERAEDGFTMDVGAHGDVTVIQSHNKTGSVVFTLQAASPTNDLFSARLRLAERSGLVRNLTAGPLLLDEINGTTLIDAPVAWLRKFAMVEFGTEGSGREWTIDCAELEMYVGGLLV